MLALLICALVAPQEPIDPATGLPIQPPEPPPLELPDEIVPSDWLVLPTVDRRGRRPFRPDAVFAAHLLEPASMPPRAGQTLKGESGSEEWAAAEADEQSGLRGRFGWAYTMVHSPARRVMMANLQGAATLYVNGDAFVGDVYRYGFQGVPVMLRGGKNNIYVTGARGGFSLHFWEPESELVIADWDATLPDVGTLAAVPWMNASLVHRTGLEVYPEHLASTFPFAYRHYAVPPSSRLDLEKAGWRAQLPPLAVLKLPFEVHDLPPAKEPQTSTLYFNWGGMDTAVSKSFTLQRRDPASTHVRTYMNYDDGSVQRAGLVPPTTEDGWRSLVLSLHGAGVAAWNQAAAYSQKPDMAILCPENRRPFGFDWQDWGRTDIQWARLDYMKTYLDFEQPERQFLTGHSMGGHGTWHNAAMNADTYLAVAPSAGWVSFDTYGGRPLADGQWDEVWRQADRASLTLDYLENLLPLPTYILHGDADDNVPVEQARTMQAALLNAGAKPDVHYEAGAGHWWGNQCMDWPPIFELFSAQEKAKTPDAFTWVCASPSIDAEHHWVRVYQQRNSGRSSRIEAERDYEAQTVSLSTENVRLLIVEFVQDVDWTVILDGDEFEVGCLTTVFRWQPNGWVITGQGDGALGSLWTDMLARGEKVPFREGPFKDAFRRSFMLIYATGGDARDRHQSLARARYDAAQWWYRGNGAAWLLSDEQFLGGLDAEQAATGPNVILYGNADSNKAWAVVFDEDTPVRVQKGELSLGEQTWKGEDLAAVFVYPTWYLGEKGESLPSLAGAFASTGAYGDRLGYTLAHFVSGVGYPDYVIYSSRVLNDVDKGVKAAGWFDHRWQLREPEAETLAD